MKKEVTVKKPKTIKNAIIQSCIALIAFLITLFLMLFYYVERTKADATLDRDFIYFFLFLGVSLIFFFDGIFSIIGIIIRRKKENNDSKLK